MGINENIETNCISVKTRQGRFAEKMCTIADKHLNVHCTGLAPAPAQAHAPAHAPAHALAHVHSTLFTNTHRSARSQKLVERDHAKAKGNTLP